MDFTRKYRARWGNLPFAPYAESMIQNAAVKDALEILEHAVSETFDQDVRGDELEAAIAFLEMRSNRAGPFDQFKRSLEIPNPRARWQNLNASLNGIKRVLRVGGS